MKIQLLCRDHTTYFAVLLLSNLLLVYNVTNVHARATLQHTEPTQEQNDDTTRGIVFSRSQTLGNKGHNTKRNREGGHVMQAVNKETTITRTPQVDHYDRSSLQAVNKEGTITRTPQNDPYERRNITVITITDLINVLDAVELYLQQEELRLVRNLELFRHSLFTLLRFQYAPHRREKRRVLKADDNREFSLIQDQLRDVYRNKGNRHLSPHTLSQDGSVGSGLGDPNPTLRDFREKIAMKLVKDNSGQTSMDLNYAFETLDVSGRYRRDTTNILDSPIPVSAFVLSTIILLLGVAGFTYLGVYLCKKHRVCTQCYDHEESALTALTAFHATRGELLNLPRLAVTSTDGTRRSVEPLAWNFDTRNATSWRRSTANLLKNFQLGSVEKSVSYPNLSLRKNLLDGFDNNSIASIKKTMPRRIRTRSLSESDCEPLLQPSPAARMMILKAKRKHRSYQARFRRQQRLMTRFPGHYSGNESSGDSGFSTPTSSLSRCSRQTNRSNHTVHHHHHHHHHHQGTCYFHEGGSRSGSFSDRTSVDMSTVSLGSTLSHASTAVSSFTAIPGQIES